MKLTALSKIFDSLGVQNDPTKPKPPAPGRPPQINGIGSTSLLALPTEIILQIMVLLNPREIVILRQTCRMFTPLTTGRDVWMTALQNLDTVLEVLASSYDLTSMSSPELERLAVRAFCFSRALVEPGQTMLSRKHILLKSPTSGVPIRPFQEYSQVDDLNRFEGVAGSARVQGIPSRWIPDSSFQNMFLVAGGRYLFTTNNANTAPNWNGIQLWDLEHLHVGKETPKPLLSRYFPHTEITIQEAFPTPCRQKLRLLVYASLIRDGFQIRRLYILYEITIRDPNPMFRQIAKLDVDETPWIWYGHREDEIIFHLFDPNRVVLWNYKMALVSEWFVNIPSSFYTKMLAIDDYIIHVNDVTATVRKIIRSPNSYSVEALVVHQELTLPPFPTSVAEVGRDVNISSPQGHWGGPHYLSRRNMAFVFGWELPRSFTHDVLEISSTSSDVGDREFFFRPVHPTRAKVNLGGEATPYTRFWASSVTYALGFCYQVFTMEIAQQGAHVCVLVRQVVSEEELGRENALRHDAAHREGQQDYLVSLLRNSDRKLFKKNERIKHYMLCPLLGRLVVLTTRSRIHVIDYIPRGDSRNLARLLYSGVSIV